MKKVLLTGGSSGIGLAICKLLTQKGYDVIGTARNPEKHSDLSFPLIQLDVTSEDSILKAFQLISERWGGLDILINIVNIVSSDVQVPLITRVIAHQCMIDDIGSLQKRTFPF